MKTGTKSILFGVHQFLWHPVTVWIAWVWLYRRIPSWRETACIIIHDWGYWGKAKMDDREGERHPELGARIAYKLFGNAYHDLCLFHSRHYADMAGARPSKLCWADKLSIALDPWWFYIPRALASGELLEYRCVADASGVVPIEATHQQWHRWIRAYLRMVAKQQCSEIINHR